MSNGDDASQGGGRPPPPAGTPNHQHHGLVYNPPNDSILSEQPVLALPVGAPAGLDRMSLGDDRFAEVMVAVEKFLAQQVSNYKGSQKSPSFFDGTENIQGVGLGCSGLSGDNLAAPGKPVLTVFVGKLISTDEVRALLIIRLGSEAQQCEIYR